MESASILGSNAWMQPPPAQAERHMHYFWLQVVLLGILVGLVLLFLLSDAKDVVLSAAKGVQRPPRETNIYMYMYIFC